MSRWNQGEIKEAVGAARVRRLLKAGHCSTFMLVDALGNVIANGSTPQVFAYDAYGVPVDFDLAAALTTLLYSGEMTDQLTGLQYLRARYYNPATGTFNRLDAFAGNFKVPQSLHKYLYTHADPVNGLDPGGLWSMNSTLVSIGIGLALTAYNGFVFWKAERSVGYGLVQGGIGSAALLNAWWVKDWNALLEAGLTGILSGLIYTVYEYVTTGAMPSHWKVQSYTLEGVNWGAFYAMYLAPEKFSPTTPPSINGPHDVFDYFGSSYVLGMTQYLSMLGGGIFDGAIALGTVLTTEPGDPAREDAARIVRATVHEAADVFLGAIVNMTVAGPIDYHISRHIPVLRGLPPRLKTEFMENLLSLATTGSLGALRSRVVDDIGDAIANAIIGE